MNGYANNARTLSGTNELNITQLNIDNNVGALTIRGDKGLPNQVLAKNGTTNRLEWDFAESTTIPVNSITNDKLKDKTIENNKIKDGTIISSLLASDITINTTGNISANDGKFDEIELPNTSVGANINVELNSTGIYTLNNKIIKSGGVLEGKTLLINNGDSNSLPMVVMGNGSVIGTLKSTSFQLPTTGQADDWVVRLNSTGINTTKDITALGTITGDDGKFDEMEFPKTGSPDVEINDTGITTSSGTAINCGGNLSGQSLGITNGQGTAVAAVGGDVDITREFKSTRVGNNTAPVPGAAYSEFALNISNAKGDAYIGRNLICGGDIYGNVKGTITEEHIAGQSLNIRTDPLGGGGATGITITNGNLLLTSNSITGNSGSLSISGNTGNIVCESLTAGKTSGKTITIGANTFSTTYSNLATNIIVGSNQYNSETKIESRLNTFGRIENLPVVASVNKIMGASTTITAGGLVMGSATAGNYEGYNSLTATNYDINLKYVNLDGRYITQSTFGNVQKSISGGTGTQVLQAVPTLLATDRTLTDTGWLSITGFGVTNVKIVSTTYRFRGCFTFDRTGSKQGKLYGRVDSANTGGSGLTSSLTTLLFFESGWFDNVIQYEMIVSGLTLNANMSFYPRFMIEGSGSAGSITFGGGYGPIVFDCIPIDSSSIWTPPAESDDY